MILTLSRPSLRAITRLPDDYGPHTKHSLPKFSASVGNVGRGVGDSTTGIQVTLAFLSTASLLIVLKLHIAKFIFTSWFANSKEYPCYLGRVTSHFLRFTFSIVYTDKICPQTAKLLHTAFVLLNAGAPWTAHAYVDSHSVETIPAGVSNYWI